MPKLTEMDEYMDTELKKHTFRTAEMYRKKRGWEE